MRHELVPGFLAIQSRPAPSLPDTHSYLVLCRSLDDGDTWEEMVCPPFGGPSPLGPTIAAMRCWPHEQIPALIDWWTADTALKHLPSGLDPDERGVADRLITHHAGLYH